MTGNIHFFNSSEVLLRMNDDVIQWLGPGFWLSFFAVGVAVWVIKLLLAHAFGPLGIREDMKNKALVNLILGGVLCGLIIVPVGQVPYVNQLMDTREGTLVTPAAAFGKRVLGDGSDYFTILIVRKALGLEASRADERTVGAYLEDRVQWVSELTGLDLVGIETREDLAQGASDVTNDARGNEGGSLLGFSNLVSGFKGTFNFINKAAVILFEYMTSPMTFVAYLCGLFLVFFIGIWVQFLSYAMPLLFVAILFVLPISYIFDGTARVVPMIKLLVALALSKPLAILFVALGFAIIDEYTLGLIHGAGFTDIHSPYDPNFFNVFRRLTYSLPLILGVGLAAGLLAFFAPMIAFLILGAEGGTLAGFISSAYMFVALQTARLAGKVATTGAGAAAAGPAGAAAGGAGSIT